MIEVDIANHKISKVNPSEQESTHNIDLAFKNLTYSVTVPVAKAQIKNGGNFFLYKKSQIYEKSNFEGYKRHMPR